MHIVGLFLLACLPDLLSWEGTTTRVSSSSANDNVVTWMTRWHDDYDGTTDLHQLHTIIFTLTSSIFSPCSPCRDFRFVEVQNFRLCQGSAVEISGRHVKSSSRKSAIEKEFGEETFNLRGLLVKKEKRVMNARARDVINNSIRSLRA